MTPESQESRTLYQSSRMPRQWVDALPPFTPHRAMRNGHVQTIIGNYFPRPPFLLSSTPETVLVDPRDRSRILCHCHWHIRPDHTDAHNPGPLTDQRLTVILVHGLEGSSASRYILGLAARAWSAGFHVIRMNMRNCGDTDHLTPTLYNSSLSGDVGAVVTHFARERGLQRFALVGYSMGGNLVLKLAGEWGRQEYLCAVAAVCPAIDLAAGSDALHLPVNRPYEWHFLRGLMRRYRRKVALYPQIYDPNIGPVRSLREFDDKIVARYCGYRDADDYYDRAAAARVVDRIATPAFILRAMDDPFIRFTPATHAALAANPHVALVETPHGGHCAYLSNSPGDDIHWAELTVTRYLQHIDTVPDGS